MHTTHTATTGALMATHCKTLPFHRRSTVALLVLLAVPLQAREFTVDSTLDAVDANPGDGLCATAGGVCSLRAAIQEANAFIDAEAVGDRIVLPAGSYLLSLPGGDEDAAASGDLDISSELSLSGAGADSTIIDGGGLDRVFDIAADAVATLTGISVRGGAGVTAGGGIRNAGVLALNLCVVEDNSSSATSSAAQGGGIANSRGLTVTGCRIRNNQANGNAVGGQGGGIYNSLVAAINGSSITGNSTSGSGNAGGGVASIAPAVTQISTSSIDSNQAGNGGGILLLGGTLFVNASAVINNVANGSIATPQAAANGLGGGLRINLGNATLVNSTFSGNDANFHGGGMQLANGSLELRNVTVSNNQANVDLNGSGDGGGLRIEAGASASARNSVLSGNLDGGGSESHPDCSGPLQSAGHLWLLSAAGCALAGGDGDVLEVDPQLGPLEANGGLTLTHALPSSSPALDAGHPDGCLGNTIEVSDPETGESLITEVPLLLDQRQRPRPIDQDFDGVARCDVGAFERQSDRIFLDGFETSPKRRTVN